MLDRSGSRVVMFVAMAALAVGMLLLSFFATNLAMLYISGALIRVGLSMLLGAPLRYIMLNEAQPTERAASQGALSLFTHVGQLVGGAVVGAVAASRGGGVTGYQAAYLTIGLVALLLVVLSFGLKRRTAERATVQSNEARRVSQPS